MKSTVIGAVSLCWFTVCPLFAQDTVLVKHHALPYAVSSVAVDAKGVVWTSTARGRERWAGAHFELVDPYDFDGVAVYNGQILTVEQFCQVSDEDRHLESSKWKPHVPGNRSDFTSGQDTSGLWWVCNGNALFNVRVTRRGLAQLPGKSTRGLCFFEGKLAAATYDGLYWDGNRICEALPFSDGNLMALGDSIVSVGATLAIYHPSTGRCHLHIWGTNGEEGIFHAGLLWGDDLLIGSSRGLGIWNGKRFDPLVGDLDVLYLVDGGDRVYVLTRDHGLLIWDGEKIRETGLSKDINCSGMAPWRDGKWVLATDRGLGIWDPYGDAVSFLTTGDGLGSNAVCTVAVDSFGTIWCSTYNGLSRYVAEESRFESYFLGVEFNRGSFVEAPDGTMYFGSVDGIYSIMPDAPELAASDDLKGLQKWVWAAAIFVFAALAWGLYWIRRSRWRENALEQESKDREREIFILRIEAIVHRRMAGASVTTIATEMGMSERHLYRKAREMDVKVGDLIRDVKLAQASRLIAEGTHPAQAARVVGYTAEYLKKLLATPSAVEK